MRHKKILLSAAGFGCATLAIVTAVSTTSASNTAIMHGDATTYRMVFNSSQNKFHTEVGTTAKSGDATARTNQGTGLKFHYESAKGPVTATAPTWHIFADGGCFYNVDPIHGLKSVSLTFKTAGKSYKILYSRDASFDQSADFTSATGDAQAFDFNGYQPNYFKVVNNSGGDLNISSVEVDFSCLNNYPCLTLSSEDEVMGGVSGGGTMTAGAEVAIKATPNQGYAFKGWYNGDELVSTANPYTFAMPSNDLSLEARFMTKAEEARRQALGIDPVIDSESKTLTYGLYPQKRVSDAATLASLNELASAESNGWYLLNGEYYARKSASPWGSSYVFDDGDTIVSGTEYWFKCEPITWKILSSDGGEYSLVSTVLLDAHRYNEYYKGTENGYYANNYFNSEIRAWLNGDFYNSAFSLGGSLIQTTTVDNSAATTDSSSNSYACDNTEDKVYLLSYQDYKNTSYFADSTARQCKTTDWARANGAYYMTISSYLYNGFYWTRSSDSSNSRYAWYVCNDGDLYNYGVDLSYHAVRPSLRIKVAQ